LQIGSNGGKDQHPAWYLNLLENPEVQVGAKQFMAQARPATSAVRSRLWELMAGIFPTYKTFQKKTNRKIPVVILEPA
jgi:deazaflavin-dependent oxidoreductase (nitroreductase family)